MARNKYEGAHALIWDSAAGKAVGRTPEQLRKQHRSNVFDVWGANDSDPTLEGSHVRFDPARDIRWEGRASAVYDQCERLAGLGVPIKSHRTMGLFRGTDGIADLELLHDLATGAGRWRGFRLGGFKSLYDAAPDLFVAQELVKATGEIVEEIFLELTAERELEFVDYNTYLQVYAWDRMSRRGPMMSQFVNAQDMSAFSFRKTQLARQQVFGSLMHHRDGCAWTDMELATYAEAQANGAPQQNIVAEEMAATRRRLKMTENLLAYFGMPNIGVPGAPIWGLITHPDIPHNAAGTFGTDSATDVENLLGPIKANFVDTQGVEAYDKIMVGLGMWAYLTTTDYKDASSDSSETVADVIMRKAAAFGIKSMVYVPEMSFREDEETRLTDEQGISAALAEIWAGGFEGEDVIALVKSDRKKGAVARGKDIAALPQEVRHGSHEAQFFMSSGGFDLRVPDAFQILTGAAVPA
jgi:hypothetical protein